MNNLLQVSMVCMLLGFVAVFTYLVTGLVRSYSIRNSLVDKPNNRSSHTTPTPRGGGLSISVAILLSVIVLTWYRFLTPAIGLGLLGGGFLVAIVGWIDDHKHIPAYIRAISYLAASIWASYFAGPIGEVNLAGMLVLESEILKSVVIVLAMTWLVNLYNFMDGTDGLAAVQAICTASFAGVLFIINKQPGLGMVCLVVTGACSGFLFWNWAPAKIFMGDVSSCLLGFVFGVLAIAGEHTGSVTVGIWLILLALFISDTTFTLIKRVIAGEKWYTAHNSHAYQKLVQSGMSHSSLAILVFLINIAVLWPMAGVAYKWDNLLIYMLLSCVILMFFLWAGIQLYCHSNQSRLSSKSN